MTSINPSVIALAEKYAREQFGMSLPLTMEVLKSAFRAKAKELHTDTSGDERTKNLFIEMKKAYDFLVKLETSSFVFGTAGQSNGHHFAMETVDGTPLYELGLGLGHLKNGRDCERCQHKGYTEEEDLYSFFNPDTLCYRCNMHGNTRVEGVCRPCKGTGKFTQERSRRVVDCRVCLGTGKSKFGFTYKTCPDCNGTKRLRNAPKKTRYVKCYECNGTGEIELFNAAWAKGRMAGRSR